MGQRLNIEIKRGDTLLANAYYHWSGYSGSAVEMTLDILNYMDNNPQYNTEDVLYAIRILESTGAGLTDFNPTEEEKESQKKFYGEKAYKEWLKTPSELRTAREKFPNLDFEKCTGRNNGLIAITEKGMDETEMWEEARVTIYIDTKLVDFDVCWEISEAEMESFEADYEEKVEMKECDLDLCCLTHSQVEDLSNLITEYQDGDYNILKLSDGRYIRFIY